MPEYYVTHPQINKTAVVSAPSTEKARTTFLDWLERNGLVQRRYRQASRKDMIAKRLEDPNVPSDVVLSYGYQEVASFPLPPLGSEDLVEVPSPKVEQSYEEVLTPEVKRMPVQEIMLRGF